MTCALAFLPWLRNGLHLLQHTLECVEFAMTHFPDDGGDDLEPRAAQAMDMIDVLVNRLQGTSVWQSLKIVQKQMQDIVNLLCSRGLDQQIMRGIPPELRARLEKAFGRVLDLKEDDSLSSRF